MLCCPVSFYSMCYQRPSIGCLARYTKSVTDFQPKFGLFGASHWRESEPWCYRLNLLVRRQSSCFCSSHISSLVSFLVESRRPPIANRLNSKCNEGLVAPGRSPSKLRQVRRANRNTGPFRVSASQSGPQPARSTQAVQVSGAALA